ncbi:hypothetical protein AB0D87_15515 [Streptomyces sp. NPDC048342]|uniref:hypothetical protein n=1 Tax=unclassified Streptomyces TaxID=2593676 RepID=UPI003420A50B
MTGVLVVNQLTLGPAGEMPLPLPGVYEGYAWWAGRAAASAYYDDIPGRIDEDWTPELIDLAVVREPEPDDEERMTTDSED